VEADIESIRILIADDHALFRGALRTLLEQESGFKVVGEATDGAQALTSVSNLKPDMLLLDIAMPRMSGLEVLRSLRDISTEVRTLIVASEIDRNQLVEAIKLGAHGVVLKNTAPDLFFKSIRAVMAGEYWIGHDGVAGLVDSVRVAPGEQSSSGVNGNGYRLSARELDIVKAIVDGCTNKDIAQKFRLSEQTVKHHLTNIFHKVGVTNRLELALFAMNHSL
jgi:two-component system, NarL family, nitrate/nitrite response regulator NarL